MRIVLLFEKELSSICKFGTEGERLECSPPICSSTYQRRECCLCKTLVTWCSVSRQLHDLREFDRNVLARCVPSSHRWISASSEQVIAISDTYPDTLFDHIPSIHFQLHFQLVLVSLCSGRCLIQPLLIDGTCVLWSYGDIVMIQNNLIYLYILSLEGIVDCFGERFRC
jgi:hypothetical protein